MKRFMALLLAALLTALAFAAFVGCGSSSPNNAGNGSENAGESGDDNGGNDDQGDEMKITLWVGNESKEFYQKVCDEYVAAHSDFNCTVEVTGMDTGTVAGTISQDASAAADIYTVAHDNVGKLASTQCAKPITDKDLIAQVEADNPRSYQNVIKSVLGDQEYVYGVPYISQALFLYYNKECVTEEQAKSFEGLKEAAAAAGTKAITVTGDDGFNMSFALLATKASDHSTTVKIYEGAESVSGGGKGTSNCQGDDTVAIMRWLQAYAADSNGFKWASADGWDADLDNKNKGVLAVIGGAWHYDTAKAALGESNLGIALIPTLTLTEESVAGLSGVKAGDVYRGGTFADCKCFMINGKSDAKKYAKEQELIKYLSSKEVQNRSFLECKNVPAYVGAEEYIKECYNEGKITESVYNLAAKQVQMAEWGIPQPFLTGILNSYYYSKNAPQVFRAIVDGAKYPATGTVLVEDTTTLDGVRKALYLVEYIWMHGRTPSEFPAQYPTAA